MFHRFVTVSEEAIKEAVRFAFYYLKLVVEPSGAVPLAASYRPSSVLPATIFPGVSSVSSLSTRSAGPLLIHASSV